MDARLQVQLSFMPEKIRAAVTSKEITPEEHSLQKSSSRKISVLSSAGHPGCDSDTSGTAVIEQLDEEVLKGIASETDFKLFKEAWTKSIEANEEVSKVIHPINYLYLKYVI